MINNRQSGRRRGRGGGGGNGPRQGGMQGNGSRIDNRARGNASQLHEKYKNMAADAQRAGDRVNTEYYLQFADHYFRVLSEQRGRFEDQQQQRRPRDDFDYDGPDYNGEDYGDEGEPIRGNEQAEGPREFRGDGNRDGNRDGSRREFRNDRDGGNRRDGEQNGRREWRDRSGDGRGENRNEGRGETRPVEARPVAGQHLAEPPAAGESLDRRAEDILEADRPLDPPARRRGRPRREDAPAAAAEPAAFEADRLPPALGVAANDEGEPAPRRRGRPRRTAGETPTAAE